MEAVTNKETASTLRYATDEFLENLPKCLISVNYEKSVEGGGSEWGSNVCSGKAEF